MKNTFFCNQSPWDYVEIDISKLSREMSSKLESRKLRLIEDLMKIQDEKSLSKVEKHLQSITLKYKKSDTKSKKKYSIKLRKNKMQRLGKKSHVLSLDDLLKQ